MSKMRGHIVSVLACLCLVWIIQVREPIHGVSKIWVDTIEQDGGHYVLAKRIRIVNGGSGFWKWGVTFMCATTEGGREVYIPFFNVVAWWEQGSDEK